MPSYLFWNLEILFSNSSLGSKKLKQNRHSLIKSRLTDLNSFIRKRVTAKSNDFTSLLFNGLHSRPYNKIGKHLHLTNSRTTSSEATLPIFPKIALVARKNPRLASSNEHLSDLDLTKWTPRYRTSSTHGKLRPEELVMTAYVASQRGPTRRQDDFFKLMDIVSVYMVLTVLFLVNLCFFAFLMMTMIMKLIFLLQRRQRSSRFQSRAHLLPGSFLSRS